MYIDDRQSFGYSPQFPLTGGDRDALAKLALKSDHKAAVTAIPERRAELAKLAYDQRRRRDRFLPPSLLGEPAWDIMLILYWAQKVELRMTVSGVSASASAPPTTALRYVEHLCRSGMIVKRKHPTDGRVSWLSLTAAAEQGMDAYFDWIMQSDRH